MITNENIFEIRNSGSKAAILFLHGFSGRNYKTWKAFTPHMLNDPFFKGWDIYSLGYPSAHNLDLPGWVREPSISDIAKLIQTTTRTSFQHYKILVFVAHSMGGLVAQKICVESKDISEKVTHLIHYGTPSAGLKKARPFGFINKQVCDMKLGCAFITDLREKWEIFQRDQLFPRFMTVAGTNDDFVPTTSSLDPFDPGYHAVIPGNHIGIVSPAEARMDAITILKHHMTNQEEELGPLLSAALAVERMEFLEAIALYEKHADELDEEAFVLYSLALDSIGETEQAIGILDKNLRKGTDTQGVLAGRLKRRWLNSRRQADAERAYQLYSEAFNIAEKNDNHAQCHYHGINSAFMSRAYDKDLIKMEKWAKKALMHAEIAAYDKWSQASMGEAYLYLGDTEKAHYSYKSALTSGKFSPREITSISWQASNVCTLLNLDDLENIILDVFSCI